GDPHLLQDPSSASRTRKADAQPSQALSSEPESSGRPTSVKVIRVRAGSSSSSSTLTRGASSIEPGLPQVKSRREGSSMWRYLPAVGNSCPVSGMRIVQLYSPPTRRSTDTDSCGVTRVSGWNHRAMSSGFVQARQTRARGAAKSRTMVKPGSSGVVGVAVDSVIVGSVLMSVLLVESFMPLPSDLKAPDLRPPGISEPDLRLAVLRLLGAGPRPPPRRGDGRGRRSAAAIRRGLPQAIRPPRSEDRI